MGATATIDSLARLPDVRRAIAHKAGPFDRPSVATDCGWPFGLRSTGAGGGALPATFRTWHTLIVDSSDFRLVYVNAGGEAIDASALAAVKSSMYVGGSIYQASYHGVRSASVDPGGLLVSDPIPGNGHAGDNVSVCTYWTSAGNYPYMAYLGANGGFGSVSSDGVVYGADHTGDQSVGAAFDYVLAPLAILGTPTTQSACVGILGDSIAQGYGTTNVQRGYIERALIAANIPHVKLPQFGEEVTLFLGTGWRHRMPLLACCTDVIVEYPVNDLRNARTAVQAQNDLLTLYAALKARGLRVWQTTIAPCQDTPQAAWLAVNAWIRANTAGINGYFETSDLLSVDRTAPVYKSGYSDDTIHPNETGVAAAIPGIVTAAFTP